MHKFPYSSRPLRLIDAVQFGILSPEEIKQMSVVPDGITLSMSYEGGVPKKFGLADPRMGSSSKEFRCQSCFSDRNDCPGHFAHIELVKPMFHYGFLPTVLKILRSVCFHCSRLKRGSDDKFKDQFEEVLKLPPMERMKAMYNLCKDIDSCEVIESENGTPEGCGNEQPKKITRDGFSLTAEFKRPIEGMDKKKELMGDDVFEILKNIPDEDCRALGFNPTFARPDWMLITVLPVPPPQVRPTIMRGSTTRSEDDLTYKLAEIIKINNQLKKQEGSSPAHVIKEYCQVLQYHVATYFNNELPGQAPSIHKSGKPYKSLSQRLKGKEGRVRGNLMGKRVDFSARTVITPDPNLSIDEVGVPKSIAMNLTYPEIVTPLNLSEMSELVANGRDTLPGACYVIRRNGDREDLRFVKERNDIRIEPGDRVERHLKNGDLVIFNRQPSLHKMSMMGHKVRIMPYSTFRLNLSVTTPYNADFDGDEMNMHVPQNVETRAETAELMMVPTQIISPQSNRPVIGLVQDALLGSSIFTSRDTFLEKDLVMNLLMWIPNWNGEIPVPAILKPKKLWTGKQLFSILLPSEINLQGNSNSKPKKEKDDENPETPYLSETDTEVYIDEGVVHCGILDKSTLGRSEGGIIHILSNEYGSEKAKEFLNGAQQLVNNWFQTRGYTIGLEDTIADAKIMKGIEQTIYSAEKQVKNSVQRLYAGALEVKPGMSLMESFEFEVNTHLNKARDDAGSDAMKSLLPGNNIKTMVNAGSKGSNINIAQIVACVGQQNVEGKRIPFGFKNRTLPHFCKDDYGVKSRGFVENSYLSGLTAQEFYFHAMGGREGLIDTAVKTSETGYIQRRLVKAMEDVMVHYDGSVRNSLGDIIQFIYGEDGMDGVKVSSQKLLSFELSNDELQRHYEYDFRDHNNNYGLGDTLDKETLAELKRDPFVQDKLKEEFQQIIKDRDAMRIQIFEGQNTDKWPLPVNLTRLVKNAQKTFGISQDTVSNLNPVYVIDQISDLCDRLVVLPGKDRLTESFRTNATWLYCIHLRSFLASKKVIKDYRLNMETFDFIVNEIDRKFSQALVNPGEMVGAIAAQSIGEPATQMTLNTFHYAGVSSKNVTLGVPRLKELINVAKKPRTPGMKVYLKENTHDIAYAMQVLNLLEYATLGTVTDNTQIWYDPDPRNTIIPEDREMVDLFYEFDVDDTNVDELTKFMLRIKLNSHKIIVRGLQMEAIADTITEHFQNTLHIIPSQQNADELILRIRIKESESLFDEYSADNFLKELEVVLLDNMKLSGIKGISKVYIVEETTVSVDDESGKIEEKAKGEYVLSTDGTQLLSTLSTPEIDHTRTASNDITEIIEVLGIEAVRQSLLRELRAVISFDGAYVNYRHLAILSDVMTYRGDLMSITRHGINRTGTGALMKCSFEETVDILVEAATFSERDNLNGVSENIMLANLAPLGTGCFDLLLDDTMLKNAIEVRPLSTGNKFGGYYNRDSQFPPMSPSVILPATPEARPYSPNQSEYITSIFSPMRSDSDFSPFSPGYTSMSPGYSPMSPGYSPTSPGYSPTSPGYSPTSPGYSPTSPGYSPTSPGYSPTSPGYSPTSPGYSPTSPGYSPSSPRYSPTSPGYSPTSPRYSPTSPGYSPTSPRYSPTSPTYSPTSPTYSPTSPTYSPTSPTYSPTSPTYSPTSPTYSPTSPTYSPTSPTYSPTSPTYSPTSPTYSPTSPTYSPTSPAYSPTSPAYSPTSPAYSPTSPAYSPTSPAYSPTSPAYSPTGSYSPATISPTSPAYSPTSPEYSPTSPYSND